MSTKKKASSKHRPKAPSCGCDYDDDHIDLCEAGCGKDYRTKGGWVETCSRNRNHDGRHRSK